MFEDALLIIKPDYMHKRKQVLLHLLEKGFQIQARRLLLFSPETAAEFYKEMSEDKCFMLYVILLSKGNAEAIILTKQNAVEDLLNTMICYFTTSTAMESHVHVSKTLKHARREISFIFPNHLAEPILPFIKEKFCKHSYMRSFVDQLYEVLSTGPEADANLIWRKRMADWLTRSNRSLPQISNVCSRKPQIRYDEKAQQTLPLPMPQATEIPRTPPLSVIVSSKSGSSGQFSSSTSCLTCTCFDGTVTCMEPAKEVESLTDIIKRRTQELEHQLKSSKTSSAEMICRPEVEIVEFGEEIERESLGRFEGLELEALGLQLEIASSELDEYPDLTKEPLLAPLSEPIEEPATLAEQPSAIIEQEEVLQRVEVVEEPVVIADAEETIAAEVEYTEERGLSEPEYIEEEPAAAEMGQEPAGSATKPESVEEMEMPDISLAEEAAANEDTAVVEAEEIVAADVEPTQSPVNMAPEEAAAVGDESEA